MNDNLNEFLQKEFSISNSVVDLSSSIERKVRDQFDKIEKIREFNQLKVIRAMQVNNLSDSHFSGTTGYGYDDRGREVLDNIYRDIFKTEDALVRHQIVAGTQALAICLYGNLRPGDELLSITGKPYDTLEEVIGLRGSNNGSLKEFGVAYKQVDLLPGGIIDFASIEKAVNKKTKMVLIQRSRGYEWRPALTVEEIGKAAAFVKNINKDVIVMVDNCYGEFVQNIEPTEVGADIMAGSLIKNPGGGLAPTGGYVVGKEEYVTRTAYRLTTPGLGRKVGPTLGNNRLLMQGLFMAPHVVAESIKGAVFCAAMMEELDFETSPSPTATRSDIIQSIKFNNPDSLIAFCQGIQKGSPVDAFVTPEPWDMPGYDSPVIMAAGAFIQGSSIELSADGPIKPPYTAYMQGGLVYENVKVGVMIAVQKMADMGIINI